MMKNNQNKNKKRTGSPFSFFYSDYCQKHKGETITLKIVSRSWHALNEKDQKVYYDKYQTLNEAFLQEKEEQKKKEKEKEKKEKEKKKKEIFKESHQSAKKDDKNENAPNDDLFDADIGSIFGSPSSVRNPRHSFISNHFFNK